MAESSFYKWLSKQYKRNDAIGDLARDARKDTYHPKTYKGWKSRLKRLYASQDCLDTFERAWNEWENYLLNQYKH